MEAPEDSPRSRMRMKSILAILAALAVGGCNVQSGAHGGGGSSVAPMAVLGPQAWTIDGKQWQIESTYYLALAEGLQFTIETPVETVPGLEVVALDQAWPLIRHAYVQQLYLRSKIHKVGAGDLSATRIGVSLFHRDGVTTRGMRVAMSSDQIHERIESEKNDGN
jgi:hypothetical protein